MRRVAGLFGLGLACLILLTACSDSASPEEAYCNDVSDVESDLRSLAGAVTSLDSQQFQADLNDLENSVGDLKSSGQELRSMEAPAVESAFNQLKQSVQAVGQGGGVSANLSAIQMSLGNFGSAVSEAASAYRCNDN